MNGNGIMTPGRPDAGERLLAITVQQPHAFAIAAGCKPVENRGQTVRHRGLLAVHTSRTVSGHPLPDAAAIAAYLGLGGCAGLWRPDGTASAHGEPLLALGAVIAVAVLDGCHPARRSSTAAVCCAPWGQALHGAAARPAHHLMLAAVRTLARPVPCAGKQTVPWELPTNVAAAVRAQLCPS